MQLAHLLVHQWILPRFPSMTGNTAKYPMLRIKENDRCKQLLLQTYTLQCFQQKHPEILMTT